MMVVGDVDHMVCVNCTEGRETITHDGEQSDQDIVNYIDEV